MPAQKNVYFHVGDKVRFLSTSLTRELGIVGKYGTVLVGASSTKHVKVMTPTRAGLMPWWFPYSALKSCALIDPRPPEGSIVLFLSCEVNERFSLLGQIGIVRKNLPQSAYSHIETENHKDHCAHFSEIERIDV